MDLQPTGKTPLTSQEQNPAPPASETLLHSLQGIVACFFHGEVMRSAYNFVSQKCQRVFSILRTDDPETDLERRAYDFRADFFRGILDDNDRAVANGVNRRALYDGRRKNPSQLSSKEFETFFSKRDNPKNPTIYEGDNYATTTSKTM